MNVITLFTHPLKRTIVEILTSVTEITVQIWTVSTKDINADD